MLQTTVPTWETAISSILDDQLHFVVFFTFLSEIVGEESGFMCSILSCSLGREVNYFYSFRKSYWPGPGSGGFLKNLHCWHWDWALHVRLQARAGGAVTEPSAILKVRRFSCNVAPHLQPARQPPDKEVRAAQSSLAVYNWTAWMAVQTRNNRYSADY